MKERLFHQSFPLKATIDEIVDTLIDQGVDWPKKKIRIRSPKLGFLKLERNLAYYNARPGEKFKIELCQNMRGSAKKYRKHVTPSTKMNGA